MRHNDCAECGCAMSPSEASPCRDCTISALANERDFNAASLRDANAEIARLVTERDEARRHRDALVAGIRAVLAPYESEINTHYEGCEEIHWRCKLRKLLREVGR